MTSRLALLCASLPLHVLAQPSIDSAAIGRIIETTRQAWEAPGIAVAIVRGDSVVYLQGHGFKRLGETAAITPDTRFAIGSTTKAFTTTAMAMLVDEKKLAWDDPVRKHYPGFRLADPLANENVTLRDIVCHRTGLSRNDALWYWTDWSRDDIIRRVGLVPLTQPFRQLYQYQNIMFLTAGEVVGKASGGSWDTFVRTRILSPLGMTNTDLSVTEVRRAADAAAPHAKVKDNVAVIPWRNIDNIGPAGSINSSARDMAQWVRFQLASGTFGGKRLVSEKELQETRSPQMVIRDDGPTSRELNPDTNIAVYGMGWRLQDYRGHHLVGHGGAIDGFRAQVALLPKDNLGIVILTNLGNNNLPEALRFALIDQLLALPAKDWNSLYLSTAAKLAAKQKQDLADRDKSRIANSKPSRTLAAYTGDYEHPAYGTAHVTLANEALVLQWEQIRFPLTHFHLDTFESPDDGGTNARTQVNFDLDRRGTVTTLHFLDQEFRRRGGI